MICALDIDFELGSRLTIWSLARRGGCSPTRSLSLLQAPGSGEREVEHLTFSRLGRGPGHALDTRPRSLLTSSGRDGDVRVPPDTAWEEVERKVGPDEGLMSRLTCPGQHQFYISDLGDTLRVSRRARRS